MLSLALWKLTLRDVLSDLPLDGGAVVVLVMMVAFVTFVWLGSRGGSARPRPNAFVAAEDPRAATHPSGSARPGAEDDAVVFHASTPSTLSESRRARPEGR